MPAASQFRPGPADHPMMEAIRDDQFTALYRWAERERALWRIKRRGTLGEYNTEVLRRFSLARLHRDASLMPETKKS